MVGTESESFHFDLYQFDPAMKTIQTDSKGNGFSLVEILIASSMATIVSLAVTTAIRTSYISWQAQLDAMTTSFELRRAFDAVARDLAEARRNSLSIAPDGQSIRFEIPTGRSLQDWAQVRYTFQADQLIRRRDTENPPTKVVGYGVTSVRFERVNLTQVRMELTVQRGRKNVTRSFQIQMRND
jgi:type II secretory pathway component PulJ